MKSNSTLETRVLNVMTDIYCKCSETAWQGPLTPALVGSDLNRVYCGILLNCLIKNGIVIKAGGSTPKTATYQWNPEKSEPNKKMAERFTDLLRKHFLEANNKSRMKTKGKPSITVFEDKELVKELRRRGYNVICTKEVTKTVEL